jgi:hypothetical protein
MRLTLIIVLAPHMAMRLPLSERKATSTLPRGVRKPAETI